MYEHIIRLTEQLKRQPQPFNETEVIDLLEQLQPLLNSNRSLYATLISACQSLRLEVINAKILESNAARNQQLQSQLDDAKAAISLVDVTQCLSEIDADNRINLASESAVSAQISQLETAVQKIQIQRYEKNKMLAQDTLVKTLRETAAIRAQLLDLNYDAGQSSALIEQQTEALHASLERASENCAEIIQVLRNVQEYHDYCAIVEEKQNLVADVRAHYEKIIHLSEVQLPSICTDKEQFKWLKKAFLSTEDKDNVYAALQGERWFGFALSRGISGFDFITKSYFSLGDYYKNQLTEQTRREFFMTSFEIEKLSEQKKLREDRLNILCTQLTNCSAPSLAKIQQQARQLSEIINIDESSINDPHALLSSLQMGLDLLKNTIYRDTTRLNHLKCLGSRLEQITQIRAQYSLLESNEAYLSVSVALNIDEEQKAITHLASKRQRYQTSLDSMKQVLQAYQALSKAFANNAEIPLQNEAQITAIIEQLHRNIQQSLSSLPLPSAPKLDPHTPGQANPTHQASHKPYDPVLDGWQQEIKDLSPHLPQPLKSWINRWVPLMQGMQIDRMLWLQCLQLLRDTRMELQHSQTTNNLAVLWSYYHLCPDKDDLAPLLELKPSIVPDEGQPLPPLHNQPLQRLIDALQRFIEQCPDEHQAALITQARYTIQYTAWRYEQNPAFQVPENIKNMMRDPRYEYLQQQRGLTHVWNTLLKALYALLLCIQPSPSFNYKGSFFYYPTPIERTINEAITTTCAIVASA